MVEIDDRCRECLGLGCYGSLGRGRQDFGGGVTDKLVTQMLPVLGRSLDIGFNVFDIMHHGVHEKQISNVFRWLLEVDASHNLSDQFARIFIDEVNRSAGEREPLPVGNYSVRQEVNTSGVGDADDIADLVLESSAAVVVIENYFTSDGHGHSYYRYLQYSQRDGKQGSVVLLCRDEDRSLQTMGWEQASVVTYATLIDRLLEEVDNNPIYQRKNPDAYSFIQQIHRKFVKGKDHMQDHDVLNFVVAMCDAGEARRYRYTQQEAAAEQFASDLASQARERFGEGRELLQQAKGRLRVFSAEVLKRQLNATLGEGFVRGVSARYSGIYQWTVNFDVAEESTDFGEAALQLKFGPSAWFAIEQDTEWKYSVAPGEADYSRIFITLARSREVQQSVVTLQEVLDGLDPHDTRLHDEMVELLA